MSLQARYKSATFRDKRYLTTILQGMQGMQGIPTLFTHAETSFARQISGEYQYYQKASGQIIPCIYCIPCTRRARTTRTEPRYKPQVAPAWAQKMS